MSSTIPRSASDGAKFRLQSGDKRPAPCRKCIYLQALPGLDPPALLQTLMLSAEGNVNN